MSDIASPFSSQQALANKLAGQVEEVQLGMMSLAAALPGASPRAAALARRARCGARSAHRHLGAFARSGSATDFTFARDAMPEGFEPRRVLH